MRDGQVGINGRNVYVSATAPTRTANGAAVGDLWYDTFSSLLKVCTDPDIPTYDTLTGGGGGGGPIDLTTDVTGILPIANGGTNANTAAGARTNLGLVIGTDVQAYDTTLASLAAYNSDGIVVQTAADTFIGRTILGTATQIIVTNGDGVGGDIQLTLPQDIDTAATPTFNGVLFNSPGGMYTKTTAGNSGNLYAFNTGTLTYNAVLTWTAGATPTLDLLSTATIGGAYIYRAGGTDVPVTDGGTGASTAAGARTSLGLVIGTDVQAYDDTLTSLAAYNTNGLLTQTAADTFTGRTLTGTAGTITVTNGSGVAGNPTVTIDAAYIGQTSITTLGTITTGTWSAGTIPINKGGTGQTTNTLAFDALAPTTTQGDILYHDGTNNVRLAKGTSLQMLTMNSGATVPQWSSPSALSLPSIVRLGSDVTIVGTAYANVTGMSFSVSANTDYMFEFLLFFLTNTSTTGAKFAVTAPTGATVTVFSETQTSKAAGTDSVRYEATAGNDSVGTSTAGDASTRLCARLVVCVENGANAGTVQLRAGAEVASPGSVTVKKGSFGRMT